METVNSLLAFFGGAVIGSFLCCFNDRLAKISGFVEMDSQVGNQEAFRYLLSKSSYCYDCGAILNWRQKIPILSFIFLRGACGNCNISIPYRLLVYEILLALCGLLCWLWFDAVTALFFFILFCLMLAIFDFDRLYMHIPNLYTGAILWLGVLASIHGVSGVPFDLSIYGVFLAYGVLYILRGLFLYFRNVEALGSGDAPLAAALAAWLGVYQVPYFLLMASIIGIFWIYTHSKILSRSVIGLAIPFGPSLVIACLVLLLFGNSNEIFALP